jgi:hypothetical protein
MTHSVLVPSPLVLTILPVTDAPPFQGTLVEVGVRFAVIDESEVKLLTNVQTRSNVVISP